MGKTFYSMQGQKKKEVKVRKLSTVYKYEIQDEFAFREVSVTKGCWDEITVEDSKNQIHLMNYTVDMAKEMIKLYELHSEKAKAKKIRKEEEEKEKEKEAAKEKESKRRKTGQD